ncbi:uncharacterized protein LOC107270885 [Cephus cinctus]|uniref:Uncharacterized protein LOC107270885 n=1 Tax=Cephus cinctus TaxID=211228 RepID=A0AAJ7W476_CEPCN|nr:uncharacterized protein LOC107270885 [Cephus cinctus]
MPVKRPTWQPALGIRKPDNIISSDYVNRKIFMPSYDSDCRVSMDQLITNEYQRIWWRERNAWNVLVAKPNARNEILLRKTIPRKKQSPSSKDNTKLLPSKSHQKNKTIIDDQKNDPNRQN